MSDMIVLLSIPIVLIALVVLKSAQRLPVVVKRTHRLPVVRKRVQRFGHSE